MFNIIHRNFLLSVLIAGSSLGLTSIQQPAYAIDPKCREISLPASIKTGRGDGQINSGNGCYFTPDSYIVKAYKLGLCENTQPLTSAGFDPSKCAVVWESDSGYSADLVNNGTGSTFALNAGEIQRPPNGIYRYAFIMIDPTVQLKATLELDAETWVTDSSTYVTASGIQYNLGTNSGNSQLIDSRTGYLSPDNGTTKVCFVESLDVEGLSITAAFIDSDQSSVVNSVTSTDSIGDSQTACPASYIVGVQPLTDPVSISDSTTNIDLSFLITDNGAWAENFADGAGNQVVWFDIGPFSIKLTAN